jgi:ADP-ribose pyrophosphatase YjhB (NUDIX family)
MSRVATLEDVRTDVPCPTCGWEWNVTAAPGMLGHWAVRHTCERDGTSNSTKQRCRWRHWVAVYYARLSTGGIEVLLRGYTYDRGKTLSAFAEALRSIQGFCERDDNSIGLPPINEDEVTTMIAIAEAQQRAAAGTKGGASRLVPDAAKRLFPPLQPNPAVVTGRCSAGPSGVGGSRVTRDRSTSLDTGGGSHSPLRRSGG